MLLSKVHLYIISNKDILFLESDGCMHALQNVPTTAVRNDIVGIIQHPSPLSHIYMNTRTHLAPLLLKLLTSLQCDNPYSRRCILGLRGAWGNGNPILLLQPLNLCTEIRDSFFFFPCRSLIWVFKAQRSSCVGKAGWLNQPPGPEPNGHSPSLHAAHRFLFCHHGLVSVLLLFTQ